MGFETLKNTISNIAGSMHLKAVCSSTAREASTFALQTGQVLVLAVVLAVVTPFSRSHERIGAVQRRLVQAMVGRLNSIHTPAAVVRHNSSNYLPQHKRLSAAEDKLESLRPTLAESEFKQLKNALNKAGHLVRSSDDGKLKGASAQLLSTERALSLAAFSSRKQEEEDKVMATATEEEVVEAKEAEAAVEDQAAETGSIAYLAKRFSPPDTEALKQRLSTMWRGRDPLDEQLDLWRGSSAAR